MQTAAGSSQPPASTSRRPSSHTAMRASWMTLMIEVFERSRPGTKRAADATPARNWPCASGSPASASVRWATIASRSASRPAWRCSGESSSPAKRMRSIADSTSSGLVSHTCEWMSHSFGPRDPNRNMKSSRPARNAAPAGSVRWPRRAIRPETPSSKAAISAGEPATIRDRVHIA